MIKRLKDAIIIDDSEIECNCENAKLEDINISHVALANDSLRRFDLILYNGKLGTKLLKSVFTTTGIINKKEEGV